MARPDLALETLSAQPPGEVGREHLHDDLSMQPRFVGKEDAAHAAAAELLLQAVGVTERLLKLVSQRGAHAVDAGAGRSPFTVTRLPFRSFGQ